MKTVYISTNLLIVFELDIKPTGLDHPPSLCSWRIQFAEWKSTSPPKKDVGCAVTLRYFGYFILLVFAIFLSRSVSDFKPLSRLWFSLPRLRGARSVWRGGLGRLTEALLRWASALFSSGGRCQQRRMFLFGDQCTGLPYTGPSLPPLTFYLTISPTCSISLSLSCSFLNVPFF